MRLITLIIVLVSAQGIYAQKKVERKISKVVVKKEALAHLTFLAADEMRGRNTGSPEIDIAANYLATQFLIFGLQPPQGAPHYFQDVQLEKTSAPSDAILTIDTVQFKLRRDILVLIGNSISLDKEVVFAGYGSKDDFEKIDVNGKIVVVMAGSAGAKNNVRSIMSEGRAKNKSAQQYHAAALVEIVMESEVPWQNLVTSLSAGRMRLYDPQPTAVPHLVIRNIESPVVKSLQQAGRAKGALVIKSIAPQPFTSKNVIGLIQGTDPKLKEEWIAVTAHYDHLGVRKNSTPDSIFNGARDNAIGTVSLLEAARYFSTNPPKRSVMLIAFTGEELGMLGSGWYANHPLIPLNQTIFNFNCDGGGYNDKTIATVIDFNRTTSDALLKKGCEAYGLTLKGDPAPEQTLYERSDNVNFAVKGIPSVNFSPGVKAFDAEVLKYYHQPSDEVGTLDMNYLETFFRAFVYCAHLLANEQERVQWKAGDKFEAAGKLLYNK